MASFFHGTGSDYSNPTTDSYENVDVLVRPDYPVAAIAQLSTLSDVSYEDSYGVTDHITVDDGSAQITQALLATNAGYKVHCGRIPPRNSLKLVMALVDMKTGKEREPGKPLVLPNNVRVEGLSTEQTFTEKDGRAFSYWFGSTQATWGIYNHSPNPAKMSVVGSYVANNRTRSVEQEITVDRKLVEAQWPLNPNTSKG